MEYLKLIILSCLVSFLLAPFIIKLLYKKNVVRQIKNDFASILPEVKKKLGTPIMGGLIFILSYIVIIFALYFFKKELDWRVISVVSGAFVAMALMGGIDDILVIFGHPRKILPLQKHVKLAQIHKSALKRVYYWITLPIGLYKNFWYALGSYPGNGLHAGEKIFLQVGLFGVVSYWLSAVYGINSVNIPFIGSLNLGWFIIPLFVFGLGLFSNGVNITDGMDGLSTGVILPSLFASVILAIAKGNSEVAVMSSVLIGGLLTYLYFNIKPARVQMGDVGSLALGVYVFLAFVLLDSVFAVIIMLGVVVAEIFSSVLQGFYRRVAGRRLFKMAPLHYHFEAIGWKEEKIVMRFWLLSVFFALIGLLVAFL